MKFELVVNGKVCPVDTPPMRRLLDILRQDLGLPGAKEGCGEGECGACAVLLDGRLVNSCLIPAFQLPGRSVETIEALSVDGTPDTLQQAFLDAGAVQCGFCTPGLVMASRALLSKNPQPTRNEIREGIAGNLCRCTGYEAVINAVEQAAERGYAPRRVPANRLDAPVLLEKEEEGKVFMPRTLEEAFKALSVHGEELAVVAGGTDLMVDMEKKGLPAPEKVLDITGIEGMRRIFVSGDWLEIGADATFADISVHEDVLSVAPALARCASQVGAVAIQNRATIGGNIATASAAADSPPVLMALGAVLVLASGKGSREMPVEDFFSEYRRTARRADELLVAVRIPLSVKGTRQMFRKVGLRQALAISRVSVACVAALESGVVTSCRIAAGSMSPMPLLLKDVCSAVTGRTLNRELAEEAGRVADSLVSPRTSPEYRKETTGNLVRRFFTDILEDDATA